MTTHVSGQDSSAVSATNTVDLYCSVKMGAFNSSGNGSMTVTCGNFGPDDATGDVSFKFITPFFVNVPALPTVAGGTASWLYENTDVNVPSIIKVEFPGFMAGASIDITVPLTLDPNAPNAPSAGRAIFTTDADNTADMDSDLTRNMWPVYTVRQSANSPTAGSVNLYYTHHELPLTIGGDAREIPFQFYNGAGSLLHGTVSSSLFTFSTPFYTRVPSFGRPSNLTALYENDDPAVPSIYQLLVPPGVGALGAGVATVYDIPFQAQSGAPFGHLGGAGCYFPTGADSQGDYSDTHHRIAFMMVVNGAL
ncbi:hypothetical protein ACFV84_00060 [Kitasatospora sp. NPDC059811]|uniref:hypothetical protein n=1 Tax=Streptomycetaceae TaxID=2062 RepID=UPI000AF93ED5|nr:hypothetical protein [Streptomyces sp. MJM8645]